MCAECPDVPEHIERAVKEAHGRFSIQSYMASIDRSAPGFQMLVVAPIASASGSA